jgi:hypothetical protein
MEIKLRLTIVLNRILSGLQVCQHPFKILDGETGLGWHYFYTRKPPRSEDPNLWPTQLVLLPPASS